MSVSVERADWEDLPEVLSVLVEDAARNRTIRDET